MKPERWIAPAALGSVMTMIATLGAPLAAQEIDLGGQVRPRFEVRDPVPGPVPHPPQTAEFTSMRTRLSLGAGLGSGIRAFVQLQDVRIWGGEAGTTDGSAQAFDLHQGWAELGDPATGRWALRIGRQELSYGGQRLIGALDWAQQARSFNGGRLRVRPTPSIAIDGIAMRIGDSDANRPDEGFYGLYATSAIAGALDGYLLFRSRRGTLDPTAEDRSRRYTLGTRWASAFGPVDWRVEAAYQLGEREPLADLGPAGDVSAYLIALRAGTAIGDDLAVELWYDRLSGDDDPGDGTDRVFDTLFATNHKFYGYMDLFVNIPVHTARHGLQDLALKTRYDLTERHSLSADLHSFHLAATDGLNSGHIGEELDLTWRWAYAPGVSVTGGASYFLAGEATPIPAAPVVEDHMVWGYVMMDVSF